MIGSGKLQEAKEDKEKKSGNWRIGRDESNRDGIVGSQSKLSRTRNSEHTSTTVTSITLSL